MSVADLTPFTSWVKSNGIIVPEASPFRSGDDDGRESAEPNRESVLLGEILGARRFDIENPPRKADPIYLLGEASIATAGNLVGIQAQAKSGKSAVTGGLLASTMDPTGDCLGFKSSNAEGKAIIHFDTEQSPYDHHVSILTVLRRSGRRTPPDWLRSYRLADVDCGNRRKIIKFEIERTFSEFSGIHSVFLDGLADFTPDPNDPPEAFAFINELHQLAIRYETTIICVIHENPGGAESGKTRGHLGSQLERKAETNLRLAKDGDAVTIYTERARHAHVPKDRGPVFQWSDDAKMHVTTGSAADSRANSKKEELHELAREMFKGVPESIGLTWRQALDSIGEILGLKPEGARRHFQGLRTSGIITKRGSKWTLA